MPPIASWWTRVADSVSRWWASSTTSVSPCTASRRNESCARRNNAAGSSAPASSTRLLKAPNGMSLADSVPETQRDVTRGWSFA